MARNGIWELQEVLLRYCGSGGSSRGVREYLKHDFEAFVEKNPQIRFTTKKQGGHPCVFGKYVTGYERQNTLKNMSPEEIGNVLQLIRDTLGRRVPFHNEVGIGVVEKRVVSVQGVWRNRADLNVPETAELKALRAKRSEEYSCHRIIDEFGVEGLVRMTQKLLDRREKNRLQALADMPKKERVMPTE